MSDTSQLPNPRPAHNPVRWLFAIIGLVVGIALGIGGGALIFGGGDSGEIGSNGRADAAAACAMSRHIPEGWELEDIEDPILWDAQAMAMLATAASYHDQEFLDLRDPGMKIFSALTRLDTELLQEGLDEFNSTCESHGL